MEKKKKKEISIYLIFFAILIPSLIYLFNINLNQSNAKIVNQGEAYIQALSEKQTVYLDGDWRFYPNKFINPNTEFRLVENLYRYDQVPYRYKKTQAKADINTGTYRVRIHTDPGMYALKFRLVQTSYAVYINGDLASSLGTVSTTKDVMDVDSMYTMAFGESVDGILDVIIHISNFDKEEIGFINSIEFGHIDRMIRKDNTTKIIESSFFVALLTLGIYFIILYIKRRDAKFLLSFALISFAASLAINLMGEQVLRIVFNISYWQRVLIETISILLFTLGIFLFNYRLYGENVNQKLKKTIIGSHLLSVLLMVLVYMFFSPDIILWIYALYIPFLMLTIITLFKLMTEIYTKEKKGYRYSVVLTMALITYIVVLMIKGVTRIDLGYIQQLLIVVVMYNCVLLVSEVYRFDYEYAQELKQVIEISDARRTYFIESLLANVQIPLQKIISDVERITLEDNGEMSHLQINTMSRVLNETQNIIFTLNDVQEAFGEHEDAKYDLQEYPLREIVARSLERFMMAHSFESLEIFNQVTDDVVVRVDLGQYAKAFYQVLENATEYSSGEGKIIITSQVMDNFALVSVTDEGMGINESDLPYIFDSFYRTNPSANHKLGLGLSNAKNIMEHHGGIITLQSKLGIGTRVTLGLPLYDGPLSEKSIQLMEIEKQEIDKEVSVVLVSDDPLITETTQNGFAKFLSFSYRTGDKNYLLQSLINTKADILVLDYNNIDVMQDNLAKFIRDYKDIYQLPILMLAPQQVIIDTWRDLEDEVNAFIATPFNAEDYILKITGLYKSKKSVEKGVEKEFKYLHSQISPHFLYNSLNTIIGLTYDNLDKTRDALYYLSVYLRAKLDIFNSDIYSPIDEELEIIESYLNIEKLRHGDSIEIIMDIDEDIDFQIPPLMLQNIIENTFRHAFKKDQEKNKLLVQIKKIAGAYKIVIEDNGKGMDDATIEAIYQQRTGGFGYKTTFQRLSLIKDSKITIDSEPGKGVRIEIILPEVQND